MKLALEAPPLHTLSIAGRDERFPVNRVLRVGRNYAAQAREMGKDPDREPPFFFMKPAGAVVDAASPTSVPYPPKTTNYHHEIELVVAIDRGGRDIPIAPALEPGDIIMTGTREGVNAVGAGDMMRGDIQGLGANEVRVTG